MMHSYKFTFLLTCLVVGIYVMRKADVSFGSTFSFAFRSLAVPTLSLCVDVDINESFSSAEISQSEGAISSVRTLRGGNPLKDFLLTGTKDDFAKDYGTKLIPVIIPWIVMLLISLLCCLSLCCNWCYLHGCCKNNRICSCCRPPQHQTKKKLFVALSSFFLFGVIGAGVAGAVISRQVSKGLERTVCSFVGIALDLSFGVKNEKWIGIQPAILSINDMKTNFDASVDGLTTISSQVDTVNEQVGSATTDIENFYAAWKDSTLLRADPEKASETYVPIYINTLGPIGTESTHAWLMHQEFKLQGEAVANAGSSIDSAMTNIRDQRQSISNSLETGQRTATDIYQSIQDFLMKIADNESKAKNAIAGLGAGFLALFLVNLGIGVLSVVSIVLLIGFRVKVFSKCLHLSWCLFILLTLLGFILSAILYTLSLVMIEGCDTTYSAIQDQVTLNRIAVNFDIDANIKDSMNTCVHGDGNMLSQFNLESSLSYFRTIFDQLDTVSKITGKPIDSPEAPESKVIPTEQELVTNYTDRKLIDHEVTNTDRTTLNSLVNKKGSPCTTLQDTWVLQSSSCTSSEGTKLTSTQSATYNQNQPTCIGFDVWMAHDDTWTTSGTTQRYNNDKFTNCPNNRATYVRNFVTNFKTNTNALKTLFGRIQDDGNTETSLKTIESRYGTFAAAVLDLLEQLRDVNQALRSVNNALVGESTGLLKNTNCKFIKTGVQRSADSMCVGFASSTYFTSIIIIIMSFMSLFSALWLFVLLKRVHLPVYEVAKTMSPSV